MPGLFEDYGTRQPPPSSEETRRMRLRLETSLERRAARRRWTVGIAAAAATVVAVVAVGLALRPAQGAPSFSVSAQQGTVQLPLPANGQLELERGGRAQVATGVGADVELLEGAVTLQVHRAEGARWVVHVDGYSVEAIGTRFRVRKTGARPEVDVFEGVVRVRGPGLPAEGQTVTAPQLSPSRELPAPPGEASVPAPVPEPAVTPPPVQPSTARWLPKFRSLLQSGELEAAVRLIPSGFPAEAVGATAKDLLDAGDLLAAAGQSARAEASYARVCVLAKGEGPCGLAQVRLAIARGNAGDAEAALSWARRYLTANPTGAFAPEMSGRRMTWLIALGRQSEALEAARDVLERWPDSKPWAAQARALLKAP